jgi:hypothetical protein
MKERDVRAIMIKPLAGVICLCAGIAVAGAQTRGATSDAGRDQGLGQNAQAQPTAPSGNESTVPQEPRSGSSTARGSLSRELSRSGGVIHPPPTDDGGVVAPPNQGTSRTPVIPPPGTPGGNPLVQPK